MSYETRVNGNPNPQLNCFCGAQRGDCPGGSGWLSPNEVEHDAPGNYANFISDACIARLARRTDDEAVQAPAGRVDVAAYDGPLTDETGAWVAPFPPTAIPPGYDNPVTLHNESDTPSAAPVGEPPRHENPSADSLEEATRLLEEQDADDAPVI